MLFWADTLTPIKMFRVGPAHPDKSRPSELPEHEEAQDEPQNM